MVLRRHEGCNAEYFGSDRLSGDPKHCANSYCKAEPRCRHICFLPTSGELDKLLGIPRGTAAVPMQTVHVSCLHIRDPISSQFLGAPAKFPVFLTLGSHQFSKEAWNPSTPKLPAAYAGTSFWGPTNLESACPRHSFAKPTRFQGRPSGWLCAYWSEKASSAGAKGRGYLIQSPTVEDILQAVEVRGHLESLAARLMAQNPNRHEFLPDMDAAINSGKARD